MKNLLLLLILSLTTELTYAQCCGNGICEPGETPANCPYDCAGSTYNCPNTVGSFFNSTTWPVSYSAAQSNGQCYTFTPPYPPTICFEYMVPAATNPVEVSFIVSSCNTSSTNSSASPGGCNTISVTNSIITSSATYDDNCNLIANNVSIGACGQSPGDIITICLNLDTLSVCPSITVCPIVSCGTSNCATTGTPIGCPPFNFTDTSFIAPCDTNSGVAIVTPPCGSHFTYLWDDPLAQIDSMATGLTPGTYNVQVTNTAFGCDTTITVVVPQSSGAPNDNIIPAGPFCENDLSVPLTAVDTGGIWSGTGIIDSITGTFDPSIAGSGSHTVQYIIGGLCSDTGLATIVVNPNYSNSQNVSICAGDSVLFAGSYYSAPGTYYDSSQTVAGCDSIQSLIVTVNSPDQSAINESICSGDSVQIAGVYYANTGTYYDTLSNASGCDSVLVININSALSPTANFEMTYQLTCDGATIFTSNHSVNALQFEWIMNNTLVSNEMNPEIELGFGTNAQLTLVASVNTTCKDSLTQDILIPELDITIPNVMTPNQDGRNDVFSIPVTGDMSDCLDIQIFNRWGELLYDNNTWYWDGRTSAGVEVPEGTYFYIISFAEVMHKGTITILR